MSFHPQLEHRENPHQLTVVRRVIALMHLDSLVDKFWSDIAPRLELQKVIVGKLAQGLVSLHPDAKGQAEALFIFANSLLR